jgi:REP element-mobilizing transposase RayT
LFRHAKALTLFARVFRETKKRFIFEIRGLCITADGLRFYIKPAEGTELPTIMKWLKQVFAQRYNRAEGREGHIWGDRYRSRILAGEPPEVEEDSETRVRPFYKETPLHRPFPRLFLLSIVPAPG